MYYHPSNWRFSFFVLYAQINAGVRWGFASILVSVTLGTSLRMLYEVTIHKFMGYGTRYGHVYSGFAQ